MIDPELDRQFYTELAEFVRDQISEEHINSFDKAFFSIKIQPGMVGITGYYLLNNEKHWLNLEGSWNYRVEIPKFHERMTQDGTSKWNRMEFTLNRDGKFNSEFIWDTEYQAEVDKYNEEAEQNDPNYKRPKWPWEKLKET